HCLDIPDSSGSRFEKRFCSLLSADISTKSLEVIFFNFSALGRFKGSAFQHCLIKSESS
ncbi:hypothetical protein GLOIN_2v1492509, partial [Rhizophagus irregularis DAOM 181602=DAOM 197198]